MDKSPDAFRTISEVAELLETPAHVLRFWESRFPQIKPVKRAGGRRYYRPADVALLSGIRHLLHDEGMTIRGVQKVLRDQGVRHVSGLADEGGDDPLEDLDLAIGQAQDPEADNVVALTEWRSATEAGETQSALREALLGPRTAPEAWPDAEVSLPEGRPETAPELAPDLRPETVADALDAAALLPDDDAMVNLFMPQPAPEGPPKEASPMQWSLFDLDPPAEAALPDAVSAAVVPPPLAPADAVPPEIALADDALPEAAPEDMAQAAPTEAPSPHPLPALAPAPVPEAADPAPLAPPPPDAAVAEEAALLAPAVAESVLAEAAVPETGLPESIIAASAAEGGPAQPAAAVPPQFDVLPSEVAPEPADTPPDPATVSNPVSAPVSAPVSGPPLESTPSLAPEQHPWLPPRLRALSQGPTDPLDLAALRALQQRAAALHARLAEANTPRRG